MSGFHVRPATPDDVDGIVAGFARACGRPAAAVAPKIEWGLARNPAGSSGVVAIDARGVLVAHWGVTHVPTMVEGEALTFGRLYASWVDPPLRTAGVHCAFAEIDDAFRELFEGKSVAATYGVFADADWWTLRRMREFFPVRTDLTLVREPGPHRPGPSAVEVVSGSRAALAGWEGALDGGPCAARRDSAVLGFRLGGPHSSDVAHVALRGGRPAGIAVVREGGGRRVVLDFTAPAGDEDCARTLFDRVVGDGSVAVSLDWFSRSPWLLLAQRSGFRAVALDLPYLGVRSRRGGVEAHWLMEHWHVTPADVGLHPNPRLLAEEEIVTSPPVGTLTGRERHA
jgi:hypothetical protein